MRSTILSMAFLSLSATSASALALDLKGSDTLESITKAVLSNPACAGVSSLTYIGGGSSTGENAMFSATPTQQVAPMSRYLKSSFQCNSTYPNAEGLAIALDGLSVEGNTTESSKCGGALAFNKSFSVPGGSNYTLTGWQDVLNLVYFGRQNDGAIDCDGAVRKALVNNWGNLFQDACSGSTCTQLHRAFRRSDLSGTTDTFLALVTNDTLKMPAKGTPGKQPFCNAFGAPNSGGGGSDYLDRDPIRRACTSTEQVCGPDGTLGLVTVVFVPEGLPTTTNFPTQACSFGACRFMLTGRNTLTCPNGKGQLFGKCFQQVRNLGGGQVSASCVAQQGFSCFGATGLDGRIYNAALKNANGTYVVDGEGRAVTGAFYRLHTTTGSSCSESSATQQIGCLVASSPCSIGFAGREASSVRAESKGLKVNNVAPDVANIEALVDGSATAKYPLARKLYFNTAKGFENITGDELNLAKCFSNPAIVNAAVNAAGFLPMPSAIGIKCEAPVCSGASTGACANNASVGVAN